jgi:hypothetical protein
MIHKTPLGTVALSLALALLVGAHQTQARAQTAKSVTVALVQTLPDTMAKATIIRESGSDGRTLILLRESNATPAFLATAMTSLARSRLTQGDSLDHRVVIMLYGARSVASLSAEERQAAEENLSRLRAAKHEQLAGVGLARTIETNLVAPPPALRQY